MLIPAVAVIGAGRVGSALAVALDRAGVPVTGVIGRGSGAAERAQRLAGAGLIVLALPDDAIATVASDLAARRDLRADVAVAHTSGRHGVAALGTLPRRLALHPVMTFAGTPADADHLHGATWGVTADRDVRPLADTFVRALGGTPAWIPEDRRVLYHAALANAANHLVTVVAQSAEWLTDAGVAAPFQALAPLTRTALDNVLALGDAALTGPVARDDADTVLAHLAAVPDGPARSAYLALARLTAERAHATRVEAALSAVGGADACRP